MIHRALSHFKSMIEFLRTYFCVLSLFLFIHSLLVVHAALYRLILAESQAQTMEQLVIMEKRFQSERFQQLRELVPSKKAGADR